MGMVDGADTRGESNSLLDLPLERNPAASIRPERFGALVYHSGNRRLLFLKDTQLATVVEALIDHPDARSALSSCGVAEAQFPRYAAAISSMLDSDVIRVRGDSCPT